MSREREIRKVRFCVGVAIIILVILAIVFFSTFDPLGIIFGGLLLLVVVFLIPGLLLGKEFR